MSKLQNYHLMKYSYASDFSARSVSIECKLYLKAADEKN